MINTEYKLCIYTQMGVYNGQETFQTTATFQKKQSACDKTSQKRGGVSVEHEEVSVLGKSRSGILRNLEQI